jgi:hypothetical protein
MRAALPLAILVLAAALLVGCGGSADTTGTSGPAGGSSAGKIRAAWERNPDCRHPQGASRWACSIGAYRCQAVLTGRGWSVDCAKPGSSIGFTVRRG